MKLGILIRVITFILLTSEVIALDIKNSHKTLKQIPMSDQPRFGMNNVLIIVEDRLTKNADILTRIERYANDIAKAYGIGIDVVSITSTSSLYLKGILREKMEKGLSGAVFIGNVPKAWGEVFHGKDKKRDIFLCDLYFMDQNTKTLSAKTWSDPGWVDRGFQKIYKLKTEPVDKIDFNWRESSPDPKLIACDYFTVRYSGKIIPTRTGTHTFIVKSDNGRLLKVKNRIIIDEWKGDWGTDYSGKIYLTKGVPASFSLDYFEAYGGAEVHLYLKPPNSNRSGIIPPKLYTDLKADYYQGINERDWTEPSPSSDDEYFGNGFFDAVNDGTGGGNADIMSPDIFVSRIEAHTSSDFGTEEDLLINFFDKDHNYWSGNLDLGQKAVLSFGKGTRKADPVVKARLLKVFDQKLLDVRVSRTNARQYIEDLESPCYLMSAYCGHGSEHGIDLGLNKEQLKNVNIKPIFIDLMSCSPLRSIKTSKTHPNGIELTSYIGGAHLFANNGEGGCLAVKGASKSSGGNQREIYFYDSLAQGKPIGLAFLDWTNQRFHAHGNPEEWFDWFYPQCLIGDPLIVIGSPPKHSELSP